jgi:nonsense-mediated mRNA decay protein 3
MRRFCYKCGALEVEKGPLIEGLCQDCFVKEHRFLTVPAELELEVCKKCCAYLIRGRWHESTGQLESTLKAAAHALALSELRITQFTDVGEQSLLPERAKGLELQVEPRIGVKEIELDVSARGKVHELQAKPHEERATVRIRLKWVTCNVCSLRSAGYYEAIVQVRGKKKLPAERLFEIKRLLETCATEARKRDRAAFIAKVDDKPDGPDFYVNPASLAKCMGELLKSKFGAKLTETSKLVGVDSTGRRKFRITVLARLPL